jgi:hypothetical protein
VPKRLPDVEVIVRPRCTVWYGEGVHPPGARLAVAEDEVDALLAQRVVGLATTENAAAIDQAIEKGLPIPGYVSVSADDRGSSDPTDPRDVARRAYDSSQRDGRSRQYNRDHRCR